MLPDLNAVVGVAAGFVIFVNVLFIAAGVFPQFTTAYITAIIAALIVFVVAALWKR